MTPKVSVVVPFWNEADCIAHNAARVVAYLRGQPWTWELVLVDDGSTDASAQRLSDLLAAEPQVRLLRCAHQGRGAALRSGLAAVRGDYVVTTEADLSWGVDIIGRLTAALMEAPQLGVVTASPHIRGGGYSGVPLWRVLLSRCGNLFIRTLIGWKITMATGMTRAYRHDVLPDGLRSDGKEFHLEILQELAANKVPMAELPATLSWPGGRGALRGIAGTGIWRTSTRHVRLALRAALRLRRSIR